MTAVSVVVPHYRQQHQLNLVLTALEGAEVPGDFEVVVADDGSPDRPVTGARSYPVTVVRQANQGFRLAAARNLGAAASRGEVLCFLDADTVPARGYLTELTSACADGWTVAVGRRRHADLYGWASDRLLPWLTGESDYGPKVLPEPSWLSEGYARTDDLRAADDSGFRYVIGAVLAVPRLVWERVGGFDESFRRYGGEDWDFAHRCWVAGADLRHVPTAVAWHDGPELSARAGGDLAHVKNLETAHLARTLPHPLVRPAGLIWDVPEAVVLVDAAGWSLGQVLLCVGSLLEGSDAAVWMSQAGDEVRAALAQDPRVHQGEPPSTVLARCRFVVQVRSPVVLRRGSLGALLRDLPGRPRTGAAGGVRVWRTRDLGWSRLRGQPVPEPWPVPGDEVRPVPADVVVEWWPTERPGARG